MQIATKNSKMHTAKTFEMNEGVGGNGQPVFVIFTLINGVCKHQEMFKNKAEANSWFKHACN